MRLRLLPHAGEEVLQATAYYRDQSNLVAEGFLEDLAKATVLLQQFPRTGAPIEGDVRRLVLSTYPYQLVYRVEGDEIRAYAVAHLKRRPGYWRQRLWE